MRHEFTCHSPDIRPCRVLSGRLRSVCGVFSGSYSCEMRRFSLQNVEKIESKINKLNNFICMD